jgi:hypothetical protein
VTEEGARGGDQAVRSFVFDVSTIPGYTNAEMLAGSEDEERFLELLGRDLVTRTPVQTDMLCVYHETAEPGEPAQPHRQGTYQVNSFSRASSTTVSGAYPLRILLALWEGATFSRPLLFG